MAGSSESGLRRTGGTGTGRQPAPRRLRASRRQGLARLAALAGAGLVACGAPGQAGGAGDGTTGATPGSAADRGAARPSGTRRLRIGTSFVVSNMLPSDNPQWHTTYGSAQTLHRILPDDKLAP